jgi:hypothetical protein
MRVDARSGINARSRYILAGAAVRVALSPE